MSRDFVDIEETLGRVERSIQRHVVTETDRSSFRRSVSVEAVGEIKYFSATTVSIAPGETDCIYLTYTGEVGGERVFLQRPKVGGVWQDADDTPGGLFRSNGPAAPDKSMTLTQPASCTCRLRYIGANRVWAVEITNTDSVSRGFVFDAEGF